jgi:hypothetical protein
VCHDAPLIPHQAGDKDADLEPEVEHNSNCSVDAEVLERLHEFSKVSALKHLLDKRHSKNT